MREPIGGAGDLGLLLPLRPVLDWGSTEQPLRGTALADQIRSLIDLHVAGGSFARGRADPLAPVADESLTKPTGLRWVGRLGGRQQNGAPTVGRTFAIPGVDGPVGHVARKGRNRHVGVRTKFRPSRAQDSASKA